MSLHMDDDYNRPPWIKMTLAELTTPRSGKICYGAAWWALTDDDHVLFYKSYGSPQCNTNRAVVERIRPAMKYVYVSMAFLPHKCSDYC